MIYILALKSKKKTRTLRFFASVSLSLSMALAAVTAPSSYVTNLKEYLQQHDFALNGKFYMYDYVRFQSRRLDSTKRLALYRYGQRPSFSPHGQDSHSKRRLWMVATLHPSIRSSICSYWILHLYQLPARPTTLSHQCLFMGLCG